MKLTLLFCSFLACFSALQAIDRTWTGAGDDNLWTNYENWDPAPTANFGSSDILVFASGTSSSSINGDKSVGGFRFIGEGTHTIAGSGAVAVGLQGVQVSAGSTVNWNSWLRPGSAGTVTYHNEGILKFGASTNHQATANSTTIFSGSGTTTIGRFSRRRASYDLTVTKTGTGTLIVLGSENAQATPEANGVQGYMTGDVTIQGGTFLAQNATGSATGAGSVRIQSGAMIGGNGSFVGNTGKVFDLASGALLQVGNTHNAGGAAQALQIGSSSGFALAGITENAISVSLNGTLQFDLTSAGQTLAIGHETYDSLANNDLLRVVSLGSLNLNAASISLAAANATGWAEGQTWKLIDWSGANLTSLSTTGLSLETTQLHGWFFTPTLVTSGSGAGYYLTASSVPEPTYATLLSLGFFALLARRKRR